MTVPSLQFLAFGLIAALVMRLSVGLRWRGVLLLAINLLFLASFAHSPLALLPFFGFVAFGYAGFLLMQSGRKGMLAILVVATLLLFCWLKKYAFIPAEVLLRSPYLTIGLSYVFFRVLHLIIDAGQGADIRRLSPIAYLNHTLNFTCIVAGPIQRYQDYSAGWAPVTLTGVGQGVERIALGFFKVMIVSQWLGDWHTGAIAAFAAAGAGPDRIAQGALVIALYPLYLYANFSGYTDAVIGVAKLMGLRLPENFDRPFSAGNFIDFWSRWHISLSAWLKTYVYNPLLMTLARRIRSEALMPYLAVAAFFATFFLVGAWHGQSAEFLFFGVLQGGGVSANKLYQILAARILGKKGYRALAANGVYAAICRALTFTWFAFTLLWFWSTWGDIAGLFRALGPGAGLAFALIGGTAVLVGAVAATAARWTGRLAPRLSDRLQHRYVKTVTVTVMLTIVLFTNLILTQAAPNIVYKSF
jgi:D-alanyl-lipoteichoic acid acyltransferase DltB (MBOAT superfamily)